MEVKLFNIEDKNRLVEFNNLVHREDLEHHIDNLMFKNPFNSIKNFAYLEIYGKIVAMVGFLEYKQQFGEEQINIGEITYVGTNPEYRKRGLIRELINYWLCYAKDKGIELCFLYGISDFYQQFGFEYAVPTYLYNYVTIEKGMLREIKGNYRIEKLSSHSEKYAKEIKTIYDKSSKENFCSKVRSLEYFKYRLKNTNKGEHRWYVVLEQEEVKGYIWLSTSDSKIKIREANIDDDEAGKSLSGLLYSLTESIEDIELIGLKLPLNNSFAKYLYKKGAKFSCTNELYTENWAGMYKILDLQASMKKLISAFEKRLCNSKFHEYTGYFDIKTEIGKVGLNIDRGKVTVTNNFKLGEEVEIPINILTSIYTGYKDINYYERQLKFKNEEIKDILKVLFPLENPYIWDLEMSDEL
ncbi:MAG: GNAT family N-acetyltransferase [Clostridiaceae bacterium]|nr:GNAT family N-acetyltransferase [Clostridiaceae bacterium]